MADHGTVEYATAPGNDMPAHESTYERFINFTVVGVLHVITIVFGLAVGGVMGHWFWAAAIFIVGAIGAVPGYLSGARMPVYLVTVFSFLVFGFLALS